MIRVSLNPRTEKDPASAAALLNDDGHIDVSTIRVFFRGGEDLGYSLVSVDQRWRLPILAALMSENWRQQAEVSGERERRVGDFETF